MNDEILEILEADARRSPEEIGRMLRKKPAEVKQAIARLEKNGVIVGYRALVNRERAENESSTVAALIEVNVTPEKDYGFDHIAERIAGFPEVKNCYLLSGVYDLLLLVEGKDMRAVSKFVAEKLSPIENVKRTVTHFMLRRYKENGVGMKAKDEPRRVNISY